MLNYLKMLLVIFLLAQFIRIDKTNHPIDEKKALHPPKDVETIMIKACYDCHSDRVRYPWYSNIAPLSWTIGHHIKEGKMALNFSKWTDIPKDIKKKRLDRAMQTVQIGMMPLPSYKWIHKDARLTKEEKKKLIEYFKSLKESL